MHRTINLMRVITDFTYVLVGTHATFEISCVELEISRMKLVKMYLDF
jgi:hypothetical protein